MSWKRFPVGLAALSLALAGCGSGGEADNAANGAEPEAGEDAATDQTIAAGLDQNSRFFQAIRAAGLDATLAGPGPYTVLIPGDQAFAGLPEGSIDALMQPQQRAQLTDVLTYHILPGTVLAEDIGRAIENANGRAVLATMGGETLSAAREGDTIILTDSAGGTATIVEADLRRSNGVVHNIDAVLMPGEAADGEEEEGEEEGAAPAQQ